MLAPLLFLVAQSKLDSILSNPKLEGSLVSATVCDLQGKILYERNGSQRVMPASNQKLLSNAYALYALGPDYRPLTRFWRVGESVVIESPGDPLMTYAQLKEAATKLRTNNFTPVYLREAYAPGIPDSWEYDDLPNKYAAPVTAFTVDRGSFELWNEDGRLKFRPESYGVKIESQRSPVPFLRYNPFTRKVTFAGKYAKETKRLDTLALPRPDENAASILGRLRGGVDKLPEAPPTYSIEGPPTVDIIAECLPPSDNNIAEHLLLMGAANSGPLGVNPYSLARQRMQSFLEQVVGVDKGHVRVFDGSGMSRHNLVTSRAVSKLLVWASQQPTAPWWRRALAYPGKGTLADRLQGVAFQGKTGTLDMVVALSGYVRTKNGQDVVVSVIVNHYLGPSSEVRAIADDFVREAANAVQ